jgi:hypothetical protein
VKSDNRIEINRAVSLVLRPVIRLLVHYGIGLADLLEMMKRLYVEVASEQIKLKKSKVTDSAVSVMTGVHRKDVHRIQEELGTGRAPQAIGSTLDQAIRLWTGDPRFMTRGGEARALPRRKMGKADAPSKVATFEDLIETASKGVPPRSVLDEWLRLGAVTLNARGDVVYALPEYAAGEELGQIRRSMMACSDRVTAAVENIVHGEKRNLVAWIRGWDIDEADIPKLNAQTGKVIEQTTNRLNQLVTAAETRGRKRGTGTLRFSMGFHRLVEPVRILEKYGFKPI